MILDILFPNRCIECSSIIESDLIVCGNCMDQVHFTHQDYFADNFVKQKCRLLFPVENAFALMKFEKQDVSRKIIHELKYRSREIIGKNLAEWTINSLDFKNERPDLFVTVPLHPKKLSERGYNQLHLFTRVLSDFYNIPYDNELLRRNHYSKAQALKNKRNRLNTEHTFSVTKDVSEKHILLIDDVFTTGNTLATIAWEILRKGNNKLSILVMAMDE
ncbi:ComF family protein [Chryseobacterium oryzae]|uniref:Double zinc ribbon domain-containing protein n=1 Tax=Chryseobacterium oryzae TaxID=2929799 RepID=A0ABY4BIE1_9FLAO|nr:double zinc ribbon domain-containing protein [Chryseobacterium oryzae]UOE38947.1 double zinc ribbon domain-containing protein [Chryseobacterium oryzae]